MIYSRHEALRRLRGSGHGAEWALVFLGAVVAGAIVAMSAGLLYWMASQ